MPQSTGGGTFVSLSASTATGSVKEAGLGSRRRLVRCCVGMHVLEVQDSRQIHQDDN